MERVFFYVGLIGCHGPNEYKEKNKRHL